MTKVIQITSTSLDLVAECKNFKPLPMNIMAPVSSIMSTNLITVNQEEKLLAIKDIFDKHAIHHIPVVKYKSIVGMISKSDFLHFMRGYSQNAEDQFVDNARLRVFKAEDIMTRGLAKLHPMDPIRSAIDIFKINRFHALPIVDGDTLVGIVTTYDIIKQIADEPVKPGDYRTTQQP